MEEIVIPEGYLKCSSCKKFKHHLEFGANKARHNGKNSNCKVCAKLHSKNTPSLRRIQLTKILENVIEMKTNDIYKNDVNMIEHIEMKINELLKNNKLYVRNIDDMNALIFEFKMYISKKGE